MHFETHTLNRSWVNASEKWGRTHVRYFSVSDNCIIFLSLIYQSKHFRCSLNTMSCSPKKSKRACDEKEWGRARGREGEAEVVVSCPYGIAVVSGDEAQGGSYVFPFPWSASKPSLPHQPQFLFNYYFFNLHLHGYIYIYIKSSLSLSTCIFFWIKIHIRSCRTLVTSSLDPIIKKHRLRGFYQVFNCGTWQGSFASVGCPTCLIDCLHVLYTKVQSSRC